MALSKADKVWMRRTLRDVVTEVLAELVASAQHGGYDGATPVVDEDDLLDGRGIGFRTGKRGS